MAIFGHVYHIHAGFHGSWGIFPVSIVYWIYHNLLCEYIASVVSMVTVPLGIENALCDIRMCDIEKYQHRRK